MDADDVADLRRIEKQVDYCLRHTNVVALGTAITYIDEEGTVTGHPGRLALGLACCDGGCCVARACFTRR